MRVSERNGEQGPNIDRITYGSVHPKRVIDIAESAWEGTAIEVLQELQLWGRAIHDFVYGTRGK